jgi:hypothetical protein
MIDLRYKPYFLPQMSAPYDVIVQKLDDEGIGYNFIEVTPDELQPSQGITFSDEVGKCTLDDKNPIWIAEDNKICDGHHRFARALYDKKPLKAVKLDMNFKDACRLLNKIQDIFEYEQSRSLEEVETQDVINQDNQINSGNSDSEFLATLEEDNKNIQIENPTKNQKTIIGYRKEPISENSVVGNFFTLAPIDGFDRYQIDFENLLDTHELGLVLKKSQQPVDILAKIWFPNINFEKISSQNNVPSNNLKAKAIAEKAMKYGYDGIKYGDNLIQGLK